MLKHQLIFILFIVILTNLTFSLVNGAGSWRLVWRDEFRSNTINAKNWDVVEDDGYPRELQYYRRQNAKIENGALILNTKKEDYWGKNFTSAKLISKVGWKYGKFEIRAKLPSGTHLWPAFWMLPSDKVYGEWPKSGEIDIMEYRGQDTSKLEGTAHYGISHENKKAVWSGSKEFKFDFSRDFHVFGFEWDKSVMRWLIDRKEYFNVSLEQNFWPDFYTANAQPFDQKFFMILNVAVSGDFFPPNSFKVSDADKWTRPRMDIDYIRVYQWQ